MRLNRVVIIAIASLGLAASAVLAQTHMNRVRNRPTSMPTSDTGMMHRTPIHRESAPASHMGMMHHAPIDNEFEFLSEMIPHHQEAIDTAAIILERSDRPEMKAFAEEIIRVQSAEIEQMQNWLNEWYPGQDPIQPYTPMMRDLNTLQGDALDQAFLEDMVGHHMGAVMMAQTLLHRNLAEHESVRSLAEQIVLTQHQEIAQMQTWLQDWFGVAGMGTMMH
jgi:uncharacterized protein (DUF305 family)